MANYSEFVHPDEVEKAFRGYRQLTWKDWENRTRMMERNDSYQGFTNYGIDYEDDKRMQ